MGIINPRGIMPEELLDKSQRKAAVEWAATAPYGRSMRLGLIRGWAATVGLTLTAAEYERVRVASVPSTPVDVPPSEST